MARSGAWTKWNLDQLCGTDIWGKTLGIIGLGRIGRAVARRAAGFRMRVIYNSTTRAPAEIEKELNAEYLSRDAVFEQADFVSLHVPLNCRHARIGRARGTCQDEAHGVSDQYHARARWCRKRR